MLVLSDNQKQILKAVVENSTTDVLNEIDDIEFLREKGLLLNAIQPTDRGICYAIASCNASFSQYLKAYPEAVQYWDTTLYTLKPILTEKEIDYWFYCICLAYLELNFFTVYNSFKGDDTLTRGQKEKLKIAVVQKANDLGTIPPDKIFLAMGLPSQVLNEIKKTAGATDKELKSHLKLYLDVMKRHTG